MTVQDCGVPNCPMAGVVLVREAGPRWLCRGHAREFRAMLRQDTR